MPEIPWKAGLLCLLAAIACTAQPEPHAREVAHEDEGADWCAEHGLPESQCTRCNPKLVAAFIAKGDYCRDHGYPASVCPLCKGTSPFPPDGLRVRLASADIAQRAGIETTRAVRRRFAATLEVVGSLAFDPNRRADLSVAGEAVIRTVHVDVGDAVEEGAPLITLRSAELGARRAELDAARTAAATAASRLERERRLHQRGLASREDLEAAERDAAAARAAERAARAALEAAGATAQAKGGSLVLRAPFAGVVVARSATAGHHAQPGETLLTVADPTRIRANLAIPEAHAAEVRAGQSLVLLLPGGGTRSATLTAVGAAVDPRTRTVPARVDLDNADGSLKGGTFVRARIETGAGAEAIVVPRGAVQRIEGRSIVFVEEAKGSYRPVAVTTGAVVGDEVAIEEGLDGGETIVTTGAFLLATETRRDSIGAGCCEVE